MTTEPINFSLNDTQKEEFKNGTNEEVPFWNDGKVIDFVNWYLKLCKLPFRYTLENQTIIDNFKEIDNKLNK